MKIIFRGSKFKEFSKTSALMIAESDRFSKFKFSARSSSFVDVIIQAIKALYLELYGDYRYRYKDKYKVNN